MTLRQTRKSHWYCLAILLTGVLLLSGCSSSSSIPAGPKGTVKGKVTYNSNPVPAGSTIMFLHEETSLAATGQIGSDGSYTLAMQGGGEVPVGKYSISVSPPSSAEVSEETNMEAYKAAMEGGGGAAATTGPFPEKYQAAETSGETFDVKEGENSYNLDMKDGGAPGE